MPVPGLTPHADEEDYEDAGIEAAMMTSVPAENAADTPEVLEVDDDDANISSGPLSFLTLHDASADAEPSVRAPTLPRPPNPAAATESMETAEVQPPPPKARRVRVNASAAQVIVLWCKVCKISDENGTRWFETTVILKRGQGIVVNNVGSLCWKCGKTIEAYVDIGPPDKVVELIGSDLHFKMEFQTMRESLDHDISLLGIRPCEVRFTHVGGTEVSQSAKIILKADWENYHELTTERARLQVVDSYSSSGAPILGVVVQDTDEIPPELLKRAVDLKHFYRTEVDFLEEYLRKGDSIRQEQGLGTWRQVAHMKDQARSKAMSFASMNALPTYPMLLEQVEKAKKDDAARARNIAEATAALELRQDAVHEISFARGGLFDDQSSKTVAGAARSSGSGVHGITEVPGVTGDIAGRPTAGGAGGRSRGGPRMARTSARDHPAYKSRAAVPVPPAVLDVDAQDAHPGSTGPPGPGSAATEGDGIATGDPDFFVERPRTLTSPARSAASDQGDFSSSKRKLGGRGFQKREYTIVDAFEGTACGNHTNSLSARAKTCKDAVEASNLLREWEAFKSAGALTLVNLSKKDFAWLDGHWTKVSAHIDSFPFKNKICHTVSFVKRLWLEGRFKQGASRICLVKEVASPQRSTGYRWVWASPKVVDAWLDYMWQCEKEGTSPQAEDLEYLSESLRSAYLGDQIFQMATRLSTQGMQLVLSNCISPICDMYDRAEQDICHPSWSAWLLPCLRTLKGMRELVCLWPGPFKCTTAADVQFLNPYGDQIGTHDCLDNLDWTVAKALAREISNSDEWKLLQKNFIRAAPVESVRGEELKILMNDMTAERWVLDVATKEDDQTQGENLVTSVTRLQEFLKQFAETRSQDAKNMRGIPSLEPLDEEVGLCLKTLVQVIKDHFEDDAVQALKEMAALAQQLGQVAWQQTLSDEVQAQTSNTCVANLSNALAVKGDCFDINAVDRLQECYRAAENVADMDPAVHKAGADAICQTCVLLRNTLLHDSSWKTFEFEKCIGLLNMLAKNTNVTGLAGMEGTTVSIAQFATVSRAGFALLRAAETEKRTQKSRNMRGELALMKHLLVQTNKFISLVEKNWTWSGQIAQNGQAILDHVASFLSKPPWDTTSVLSTFASAHIRRRFEAMTVAFEAFAPVAGCGPREGTKWHAHLAPTAGKVKLMEAFNASFGSDDWDTTRYETLFKEAEQSRDAYTSELATWKRFHDDDEEVKSQQDKGLEKATAAITLGRTSYLENWILRLAFGCGNTRAKVPEKSLSLKVEEFESHKLVAREHVLPALWKVAQPMLARHAAAQASGNGTNCDNGD